MVVAILSPQPNVSGQFGERRSDVFVMGAHRLRAIKWESSGPSTHSSYCAETRTTSRTRFWTLDRLPLAARHNSGDARRRLALSAEGKRHPTNGCDSGGVCDNSSRPLAND
jgi:hypothetical protein